LVYKPIRGETAIRTRTACVRKCGHARIQLRLHIDARKTSGWRPTRNLDGDG